MMSNTDFETAPTCIRRRSKCQSNCREKMKSAESKPTIIGSKTSSQNARTDQVPSRRSKSPILVTKLRRYLNDSDKSILSGTSSSDPCYRYDDLEDYESDDEDYDTFDASKMIAPVTSANIALKYEFHRLAKSVAHPDYTLGQEGRPEDMIVESSKKSAKFAPSLLRQFDAAFLRRSDGSMCYTMLIDAHLDGDDCKKWSLTFVVDEAGSTKTVFSGKWAKYVRLIREPIDVNALKRSWIIRNKKFRMLRQRD
mmetsp:Transcript_9786/g.19263  ORF Transcript_9786/g.19263 Transcript_9786/m.19263 type:complete len:253 (+) Transcript_9786:40-798(+)